MSFKRKTSARAADADESATKRVRDDMFSELSRMVTHTGPVTSVVFPKELPTDTFPYSGIFEIAGASWKATLLHHDKLLFRHTLRGCRQVGSKFPNTYVAQVARTDSVRMKADNFHMLLACLLGYSFRPAAQPAMVDLDRDVDPATAGLEWNEDDVRQARRACHELKWTDQWSLEPWLYAQADSDATWARVMLANPIVQIYLLCIDGGRLMQYYPWHKLEKMTVAKRRELVAQLNHDHYPLFFEDQFHERFPGLPEIKLKNVDEAERKRLGHAKLLNIWLYRSISEAIVLSKHTYVRLKRSGAKHMTVHLPHVSSPSFRELQTELVQLALPWMTCAADESPNFSFFNWQPAVEELLKQGSLQLLVNAAGEEGLQPTNCWRKTLQIVEVIHELRSRTPLSNACTLDETAVAQLCDEQRAAVRMVVREPVSLLTGAGGTGKTESICALPGIAQSEWKGDFADVLKRPDDFYGLGKTKSIKDETTGVTTARHAMYLVRATKLVLAPTGKAAQICAERGLSAYTAHYFMAMVRNNPKLAKSMFGRVQYVIAEEMSMQDEWLLADTLHTALALMPDWRRLLFTGDFRQLFPVGGPGMPLLDLMACKWLPKLDLQINHRAGAEAKLLVDNSLAISRGTMNGIRLQDGVFEIVAGKAFSFYDLAKQYEKRPMDVQLMCHTNRQRNLLNGIFLRASGFGNAAFRDDEEWADRYCVLSPGQKVVITRNGYFPDTRVRVCNGEISMLSEMYDTVDGKQQVPVKTHRDPPSRNRDGSAAPRFMVLQGSKKIVPIQADSRKFVDPGYALTVHKMQGGAVEHAVVVDDYNPATRAQTPFPLSRQALYVAASRARKRFTYIALNATNREEALESFQLSVGHPEKERATTMGLFLQTEPSPVQCPGCSNRFTQRLTSTSRVCQSCDALMSDE